MKFILAYTSHTLSLWIFSITCVSALISLPAAELDTPLEVFEISGVMAVSRPVSIVVPLPPRQHQDPGTFHVTDEAGIAIPAQIRAERRWTAKDNSLREVRVDFKATVPANGKSTYHLRLGENPVPAKKVMVTEGANQWTVDNGRVKFTISKTGFNLLDEVWHQGNLIIDNTSADGAYIINRFGKRFLESTPKTNLTPLVIEVLENGPVKSRIRVERPSWFVHDAADPYYNDFPEAGDPVPGFVCWFDVYYDDDHIRINRLELNSGIVAWNNGHKGDGMTGFPMAYDESGLALRTTLTNPEVRIANETTMNLVTGTLRAVQGKGTFSINGASSGTTGSFAMVSQGAGAGFMVSMPFFAEMQPNGWAYDPTTKVFTALTAPVEGGGLIHVTHTDYTEVNRPTDKYIIGDMSSQPSMLDLVFFSARPTDADARALASQLRNRLTGVTTLDQYRRTGATTDLFGIIPAAQTEAATTGQSDYSIYEAHKQVFGMDLFRWAGPSAPGEYPYANARHTFQRPPRIHVDEIGSVFSEVTRSQYAPAYWAGVTTPTPYKAFGSGPDILTAASVTPAHAGPEFSFSPWGAPTGRAFYGGGISKFYQGKDYQNFVPLLANERGWAIGTGRDPQHNWLQRMYDTPGDNPIADHYRRAATQLQVMYAHQLLYRIRKAYDNVDIYGNYASSGNYYVDSSQRGIGNNLIELVDQYAQYGDPDALTAIDYLSECLTRMQMMNTNGNGAMESYNGTWIISFQDGILLHGLLNALQILPESSDVYKRIWAVVFGGGPNRLGKPGLVDACIAGRCAYYVEPGNPNAGFGGTSSAFVDVIPVAGWLRATRPDPYTGVIETAIGKSYVKFMIDALDEKIGPGGVGGKAYFVTYPWRTAHVWDGGMQGRMMKVLAAWETEPDPTKWYLALGLDPSVYPAAAVPAITSTLTTTSQIGQTFSYTITANQNPTSFSAIGLPSGLSVNTATGLVSGTPTASGRFSVTISATNASGSSASVLQLTVVPGANYPTISSSLTAAGRVGTSFTYAITASNTPLSYQASGLPPGLSFNTVTGIINGIPTSSGSMNALITAINSDGSDTKTLIISIEPEVPAGDASSSGIASKNGGNGCGLGGLSVITMSLLGVYAVRRRKE